MNNKKILRKFLKHQERNVIKRQKAQKCIIQNMKEFYCGIEEFFYN